MSEETKTVEQPHSCKIAVNAKGQWSGEVKVYAETPEEAYKRARDSATTLALHIHNMNKEGSP